jgi:hypothetical protein
MDTWTPRLSIGPDAIGLATRCPRCTKPGVIDDIGPNLHVIIRHDATTWHVMKPEEAAAISWERCLLQKRPARQTKE